MSSLTDILSGCGYKYYDSVSLNDSDPHYEVASEQYWAEHLHPDPEARLITEGSGYFDFRHEGRYVQVISKC